MPFNGSGVFALASPAFVAGTTISSSAVNTDFSDIATNGLSKCVTIDGQNIITGQLKFPTGSAAAPSIAFASDLTTGMYYLGTKHIGFSTGGSEIVGFNGNNLGSGQSGNVLEINTPSGVTYPNPVGMVADYAGATAPAGWLLCYGQSLLIATYPELFVAISNTYGGDGISTFFAPDCRGLTVFGKQNMGGVSSNAITVAGGNYDGSILGNKGGNQNHTLTTAEMPVHNHGVTDPNHTHNSGGIGNFMISGSGSQLIGTGGSVGQILNTAASATNISINNAGSGNFHPIINPSIIFNKIIYAGRV